VISYKVLDTVFSIYLQAETILSKLSTIKSEGLREYLEQWVFSELLPKLPHRMKHVEILRVYVLFPLIPNFYSGELQCQ
jgi:hypothetical protein